MIIVCVNDSQQQNITLQLILPFAIVMCSSIVMNHYNYDKKTHNSYYNNNLLEPYNNNHDKHYNNIYIYKYYSECYYN